jgi:hypothetical protein
MKKKIHIILFCFLLLKTIFLKNNHDFTYDTYLVEQTYSLIDTLFKNEAKEEEILKNKFKAQSEKYSNTNNFDKKFQEWKNKKITNTVYSVFYCDFNTNNTIQKKYSQMQMTLFHEHMHFIFFKLQKYYNIKYFNFQYFPITNKEQLSKIYISNLNNLHNGYFEFLQYYSYSNYNLDEIKKKEIEIKNLIMDSLGNICPLIFDKSYKQYYESIVHDFSKHDYGLYQSNIKKLSKITKKSCTYINKIIITAIFQFKNNFFNKEKFQDTSVIKNITNTIECKEKCITSKFKDIEIKNFFDEKIKKNEIIITIHNEDSYFNSIIPFGKKIFTIYSLYINNIYNNLIK